MRKARRGRQGDPLRGGPCAAQLGARFVELALEGMGARFGRVRRLRHLARLRGGRWAEGGE